jgi:peptide chain release factor 2
MQELEGYRDDVEKYDRLQKGTTDLEEMSTIAESDDDWTHIEQQVNELAQAVDQLDFLTLFSGEFDAHDVIVTIHTGAGGIDAQEWSEMLLAMYLKWAESKGYKVTVLDKVAGQEAGIKNTTIEIADLIAPSCFHHLTA